MTNRGQKDKILPYQKFQNNDSQHKYPPHNP